MTVSLTGAKIDIGVGILANAFLMVIMLTVAALDAAFSGSHAMDVQAELEARVADVMFSIRVDVFARVDARIWMASMTALECLFTLISTDEASCLACSSS